MATGNQQFDAYTVDQKFLAGITAKVIYGPRAPQQTRAALKKLRRMFGPPRVKTLSKTQRGQQWKRR